jgi:D-arginine dehydrogenase
MSMESLPEHVEVAVVGGGLAGLATAWAIGERAGRDAQVVVLERDATLASHASGRNAAMCRALAEDDAWTALTAAGAAFLRRPPAGFSEVPLVDDRGALLLAEGAVADELLARAARFDLRCAAVGAGEVARRWPGLEVTRGGVWFPDDGNIELGALVDAYARGARRAGVRIVTGAEVRAIEASGRDGDVAVVTSRGVVRARQVVIAAGPWADEVAGLADAPPLGLVSRRRHIIALDARANAAASADRRAAAAAAPASAANAPIVWNVDGDEWYVRPAGHEVWASACDSDTTAPGDIAVREGAADEVRARIPAPLDSAALRRVWACQRTFAAGAPVVARDRERPWLVRVVGLGGHGVTASAAIGRAAAALVLA